MKRISGISGLRNEIPRVLLLEIHFNFLPKDRIMMQVAQCWDDGVLNDIRVAELCRKYGAKATFNLNPGLHRKDRRITEGWEFKNGYCPGRLAWNEVKDVFDGFEVASHTMCHCGAGEVDDRVFLEESMGARRVLEDLFGRSCRGFAWPCGRYTPETMQLLREAGFAYARTTEYVAQVMPCQDTMAFHSNCHFMDPGFWDRFEAAKPCGKFYFWGHSYEMMNDPALWADYESKLARFAQDPGVEWVDVIDLVR